MIFRIMKSFVYVLLFSSAAWAQSVSSYNFEFSDTLETVGMEDALGPESELVQSGNPFLFRASLDYSRDSLSSTRLVNNPISIVDHLYSVSLGGSALVHPRILLGIGGSLHYIDLSRDYVTGQFDETAWKLGDMTVHAKVRLTGKNSKINVAFRPWVGIPTGSGQYLVSDDSFRWGGRILLDSMIQEWKVYFHAGLSHASNATFLSLNEKTFVETGLGLFYSINSRFGFNAEWLQSISVQNFQGGQNPTQVNLGLRYNMGTSKVFMGGGLQGFDFAGNNRPYMFYVGIKRPFGSKKQLQPVATTPVVTGERLDSELAKVVEELQVMVVYFDNNRSKVKSEHHDMLNQAAKHMNDNNMKIQYLVLHGHADPRGDEAYNERLSQRRAQAVKEYLIMQGVNEHAILIDGYGESVPKTTEEKDYRSNRRVEFQVIKK